MPFKFGFLSDTHIQQICKNCQEPLDRIRWFEKALDGLAENNVDFIFHGGDFTDASGAIEQLEEFDKHINPSIPWYPIAGNHDVGTSGTQEKLDIWLNRGYGRGENNREFYGFIHKDAAFYILNTFAQDSPEPEIKKRFNIQLDEMDDFFSVDGKDKLKIVCGHSPLFIKSRDEADEYFNIHQPYRKKILFLMNKHKIKYYLCGHRHEDDIVDDNGLVSFMQTATSFQLGTDNRRGYYIFDVSGSLLKRKFYPIED